METGHQPRLSFSGIVDYLSLIFGTCMSENVYVGTRECSRKFVYLKGILCFPKGCVRWALRILVLLLFSGFLGPISVIAQPELVTDPPYVPTPGEVKGNWVWFDELVNGGEISHGGPRSDSEISWSILEETIAKADEESASRGFYTLQEARKRLEKYVAETPRKRRDSKLAEVSKTLREKTSKVLAELRASKAKETAVAISASPSTADALVELWKRISHFVLPIPFTLHELSQVVQVPIFLSGPHVSNFDLRYVESFGHYNPAALEWAKQRLVPRDVKYFQKTSSIFQKFLSYAVRQLLTGRYYLESHQNTFAKLSRAYKNSIAAKRSFIPNDEIERVDERFGLDGVHLAYWLRRDIDGTASSVQELLELLLDAYSPGQLQELQETFHRSSYELGAPSAYHASETFFAQGEKVFSLQYGDDAPAVLNQNVVQISNYYDPIEDQPNDKTGKEVSLKYGQQEQVFILRGDFTAGPIPKVKLPSFDQCLKSACRIELSGNLITIVATRIEFPTRSIDESAHVRYILEWTDGGRTRVIDDVWQVLWSGDLNRDGHLDLIYEGSPVENDMTMTHLLLSSPSSKYTPLQGVAHLWPGGGC